MSSPFPVPAAARSVGPMLTLLIVLLIIWLALSIVGFVVKGLLWLAIIGIVLFVITAIVGGIRRFMNRSSGTGA